MDGEIERVFIRYAQGRGLTPKTLKDYSYWISRCEKLIFPCGLAGVDSTKLKFAWDCLPPSARTRNQFRCALVALFSALGNGEVARGLPRLREKKLLPRPLPSELIADLVSLAYAEGEMWGCLTVCSLNTGLRLGEVLPWRWEYLTSSWLILRQKGGDERKVYLNSRVRQALERYSIRFPHKSGWVFPSPSELG